MSSKKEKPYRGSATVKLAVVASTLKEAEGLLEQAVRRCQDSAPRGVTISENARQRFITGPLGDN